MDQKVNQQSSSLRVSLARVLHCSLPSSHQQIESAPVQGRRNRDTDNWFCQMRFVTCIVRERQLRLYGHVACFPDADPTHQILSARESHEWRRPIGRPHASWLQQVDRHLKEMGMGQASAWGMARQRPLEYRRKVDAATRCNHEARGRPIGLLHSRGSLAERIL